jgi:hypothetical protein
MSINILSKDELDDEIIDSEMDELLADLEDEIKQGKGTLGEDND